MELVTSWQDGVIFTKHCRRMRIKRFNR